MAGINYSILELSRVQGAREGDTGLDSVSANGMFLRIPEEFMRTRVIFCESHVLLLKQIFFRIIANMHIL